MASAQESSHTPVGSSSELERNHLLVPVDLAMVQPHEAHLGRLSDVVPAPGHHVGDESGV